MKKFSKLTNILGGAANPFMSYVVDNEDPISNEDGTYTTKNIYMPPSLQVYNGETLIDEEDVTIINNNTFKLLNYEFDENRVITVSYVYTPIDTLIQKIEKHLAGEEFIDFNEQFDLDAIDTPSSTEDQLTMLNQCVPAIASMAIFVAQEGMQQLTASSSSDVENYDSANKPGTENTNDESISPAVMAHCNKYYKVLRKEFERGGETSIHQRLLDLSVPERALKKLSSDLTTYANGPKARGGLNADGGAAAKEKIRRLLFEFMHRYASDQKHEYTDITPTADRPHPKTDQAEAEYEAYNDKISKVVDSILQQVIALSNPTADDLKNNTKAYANLLKSFNKLVNGTAGLDDGKIMPFLNSGDADTFINMNKNIAQLRDIQLNKHLDPINDWNELDIGPTKLAIEGFVDFARDLELDKDAETIMKKSFEDLLSVDRLDNLHYLVKDFLRKEAIGEDTEETEKLIEELKTELTNTDNGIFLNVVDINDKEELIESIETSRKTVVEMIRGRISKYDPNTTGSGDFDVNHAKIEKMHEILGQFYKITDASRNFHTERYRAKIIPDDSPDKEAAQMKAKEARGAITKIMTSLESSAGIMVSDESDESNRFMKTNDESDEYLERQEKYKEMILSRNKIFAMSDGNEKDRQRVFIYNNLIDMTKSYNKPPPEISRELLKVAADYHGEADFDELAEAHEWEETQKRNEEIASDDKEMGIYLKIPGNNQPIKAAIYPVPHIAERLEKILDKEDIEVSVLNPSSLLRNKKTMISIDYQYQLTLGDALEITKRKLNKLTADKEKLSAMGASPEIEEIEAEIADAQSKILEIKKNINAYSVGHNISEKPFMVEDPDAEALTYGPRLEIEAPRGYASGYEMFEEEFSISGKAGRMSIVLDQDLDRAGYFDTKETVPVMISKL